jgi:hypothetical protein
MRTSQPIWTLAVVATLVAACGSSSGGTPGPGGTQGSGSTPGAVTTPGDGGSSPVAGGGGTKPAGWDANGKVHYEITGGVTASGDLGFVPVASVFGGTQQTSLSYTIEGASGVMAVLVTEGKVAVSYGNDDYAVTGADCTTSNLLVDATTASGSFDCAATIIKADGSPMLTGRIKGTFDAHK